MPIHPSTCQFYCTMPQVPNSIHLNISLDCTQDAPSLELENPLVDTCRFVPPNLHLGRHSSCPFEGPSSQIVLPWLELIRWCSCFV